MIYRKIIGDITVEFEGTKDEILHIISNKAKMNVIIQPNITLAEKENIIETIEDEINRSLKNMGFQ